MKDNNSLDSDEYLEILQGVENLILNPTDGVGMGGMMIGDGLKLIVYTKRLKGGIPRFLDFDFIKRYWVLMTEIDLGLKNRIEMYDKDLEVDADEMRLCEEYFMEEGHSGYEDVVSLNNGLMMNLALLRRFYISILSDLKRVLDEHVLQLDARQKDCDEMYGLLNVAYEHYRDEVWRKHRQEIANELKLAGDGNVYLLEMERTCTDRLSNNFFVNIHGDCCDDDGQSCDYLEFARQIFLRNNRGWVVSDLEDYFDIVLTMDYVEGALRGRTKYTKHALPSSRAAKGARAERLVSDTCADLAKTLDWAFRQIEGFLGEGYTVNGMISVVHNMLTDKPINDKHKRVQREFMDFMMNKSSIRPGEYLNSVSVQSLMRLLGVLCANGIIKPVKPVLVINKVISDLGSAKIESYRTYYYKGKNELARHTEYGWIEWLVARA